MVGLVGFLGGILLGLALLVLIWWIGRLQAKAEEEQDRREFAAELAIWLAEMGLEAE